MALLERCTGETMSKIDEYAVIYWAAACLAFVAGCGLTDGQLADAVNIVCDDAKLTVPQEALLKKFVVDLRR